MADLENAIKRLNEEIAHNEYWDEEYADCVPVSLLKDALELLKAQEPIEPIKHLSTGQICGSCKKVLLRKYKYCPACGKAVKWDG